MDYLQNHIWCPSSNWGDEYDCRHLVSIPSYGDGCENDWENITTIKRVFNKYTFDMLSTSLKDEGSKINKEDSMFQIDIHVLKPEVLKWLYDNVKDYKGGKGWCVGSEDYNSSGLRCSIYVFFQRKGDAMKFIKVWSEWRKPINYCQYFTDVRKTLNLKTLKYE